MSAVTRSVAFRHSVGTTAACLITMLASLSTAGARLRAQETLSTRPVEVGLMVGGVGVTGAFQHKVTAGAAVGAELQVPLSSRRIAFRGDVLYQLLAPYSTQSSPPGFVGTTTSWTQVVSGSLSVVVRLSDPAKHWSPYFVAGGATYNVGTANSPLETSFKTSHFGLQGGLGLEARSSKHTWFAELRYMHIAPGGVVPLVFGIRF